ncbi:MAG: hypothetical protein HYX50_00615 [Chloroflexi bacterium]|nr:hypothetical protein [Chloroflexota bacterium]
MANTVLLIPSRSRAMAHVRDLQDFCATLSTFVQEDVGLWLIDDSDWTAFERETVSIQRLEQTDHHGEPLIATPMSAAPFRFRDDGRPDWATMWQGFCELALYGGPPHRGADQALVIPELLPAGVIQDPMVDEITRGIGETTGLEAEPAPGGWIRVACDSKRMAAWLCATIILENVDARAEGSDLFVPGGAGFDLKDQVKSVITVVAKSNHYWQAHIAEEDVESPARAQARSILRGENIQKLRRSA